MKGPRLLMLGSFSEEFQLVWTSPAPCIGVIAQSSKTPTLASLYSFLSKVRSDAEKELAQYDQKFANFGCHLCLYVRGQQSTTVTSRQGQILTENGELNENSNIVGYIQMDESQYVQCLPCNLRRQWLEQFKAAEHFVRT